MLQNADNKLFSLMFRSVTASIHYYLPMSKELTLYSAALELLLPCLTAVIYCTNNRSSIDVFFAIAIDLCCCVCTLVFHIFILQYHTIIFLYFNWMAFVRINK